MKNTLGNIYDLQSFDGAKEYFATQDSAGGTILARNLEHVSSEIFKQRIAGLTFLTGTGIIVNNEGGYADTIKKIKESINGDFADAGQATDGTGKISLATDQDSIAVSYKEAKSNWSDIELQKAQRENRNLPSSMISAHDQKYKQNIDTIGYLGKNAGGNGLLNYSGFTAGAATDTFDKLDGQAMYDEISQFIVDQRGQVLNDEVFSCSMIGIHPTTFNIISKTFINTAGGLSTVKEAIERTQNVAFVQTSKAEIAGVKRLVAYSKDRQAMQMRIPVPLKLYNQVSLGSRHYIESMFGVAGLDVIENGSGRYLTGV